MATRVLARGHRALVAGMGMRRRMATIANSPLDRKVSSFWLP